MFPPRLATFLAVRIKVSPRKFFCLLVLLTALGGQGAGAQQAKAASRDKFLNASDIHFNPMADPKLVAELAAADPTHWEAILQRTEPAAFSLYGQDTNWWLLQSALDQMRKTLPNPAFVMYTGDLLAHEFPKTYRNATHDHDPEHYRAFVLKTVQFLALEFRKRFPGTKILLTPGNNDEDCGDYSIAAGGIFLSDTAGVARELARADAIFTSDWKALGSYNVPHPTVAGVRILSLNSIFFSNRYHATSFSKGCATVESAAAGDLFNWLKANLAAAQQANQKVWLVFHIPPGIDGYSTTHNHAAQAQVIGDSANVACKPIVPMWVPTWTQQVDGLLEEFQSTVIASFAGHTHNDDFRLVSKAGINRAFVLIDPAVSPIYDQNPGFRIVTFARDGSLVDQTTYYLANLKQASSKVRGRWKKEYQFTREWKMPRLDLGSLGTIYSDIQTTKTARDRWLKLYNVSSAAAIVPPDTVRGLYCAVVALDVAVYQSCYCPAGSELKSAPAASK
jgi:sphingomyelin phosphodiesterase acid-like 3